MLMCDHRTRCLYYCVNFKSATSANSATAQRDTARFDELIIQFSERLVSVCASGRSWNKNAPMDRTNERGVQPT